jgi:Arc/MetJ-type ribon-helix-helix transcriptional regulator
MTMSRRFILNLTERMDELLKREVQSGRFATRQEVIRNLIREHYMRNKGEEKFEKFS